MAIQFLFFFIFFWAFIGLTHLYVYFSFIKQLGVKNFLNRIYLLIIFSFLSSSFIIASVLVHYFENVFTDTFYLLSSAWSGILFYLITSATLGWIIFLYNKISPLKINLRIATIFLLLAAVVTSLYGIVHAGNPRILYHEIDLQDLPESWHDRTAVHISDLHLGAILGEKYGNKIMDMINDISPDIIFITGDYFDGTSKEFEKLAAPLKKLHPELGTFFISGNHETYAGLDEVTALAEKDGVKYLKDEIVEVDGLQIIGFEYARPGQNKNYAKLVDQADKNKPSVLLYHEPRFIEAAKAAGIDLQLAGHTHEGQMFPFGYITAMIYGQYHHGFFKEDDYVINTTSGVGTWGPPLRVGTDSEITVLKFK
jgi:hypothetical protein